MLNHRRMLTQEVRVVGLVRMKWETFGSTESDLIVIITTLNVIEIVFF